MRATRRRPLCALALLLAAAVAADQLVQWTLLRDGMLLGRRIAPFDPPLFCPLQTAKLDEIRARLDRSDAPVPLLDFDAELGWCSHPSSGEAPYTFDAAGARIAQAPLAREPGSGRERIVAVGDSFTFGLEVGPLETWLARLEEAQPVLECANLGVCGYDLAQSLLRWRRDGAPLHPRELWVGFVPSQVLRNVTLYVPAWRHWTPIVAFKPRAELGADGSLAYVPCPVRTPAELLETLSDQPRFLRAVGRHDRWVDACPEAYAPRGSALWQQSALGRLWYTALEHGGREPWVELEQEASETVELFVAQFRALASELRARSVRLRLLVLPDREDLAWLHVEQRAYWGVLVARLEAEGLEVFDASAGLLAERLDASDAGWAAGGHYSARTNALVAQLFEAHLRAHP